MTLPPILKPHAPLLNVQTRATILALTLAAGWCSASPLTIFDQQNRAGTGIEVPNTHVIYLDNAIPGQLNNKISSFRLEQGYVAVVAVPANAVGPAQTYVADNGPLMIDQLPASLDNAISFIRVLPWKQTPKKGTGGNDVDPSVNPGWYYNWGSNVANGQAVDPREYVPMTWGAGSTLPGRVDDIVSMNQITHLLGFNEPDDCNGQSGQWNNLCDVPTAVGYFMELQRAGVRLGTPGTREEAAGGTTDWLTDFIQLAESQDQRIDFVPLHWYDWGSNPGVDTSPDPNAVFNRFAYYLSMNFHQYRKPLWITEFNANPNRDRTIQDAFLLKAMPHLDRLAYVERYAYFEPSSGTGSFRQGGQLTSTGQLYKTHVSPVATVTTELPSTWQQQDVGTAGDPGIAMHVNGTFTVCGGGGGIGTASDAFYFAYQPMEGDVEVVARVDYVMWRANASIAGVMIRDSLDPAAKHATMGITASQGAQFRHRAATGGNSSTATTAGINAPYWVKLTRLGDTLSGYYSVDGVNWTLKSSQPIGMGQTVYAGMAVSAHNTNGAFNDSIFSNVSVTQLTTPNRAPLAEAGADQGVILGEIGASSPVGGATFDWDAAASPAGSPLWQSTTATPYNWTFDTGSQIPEEVADTRFDLLTHAYAFPAAMDASNTSFSGNGDAEPATFEFVIDVDGADGSIFETGGAGDGIQVDVVGGVLRGTVEEDPTEARATYILNPTDLGRFIHVIFVADNANNVVQLYVDGELKDSQPWTTGNDWAGNDAASLGSAAGTIPDGGSTAPFTGKLARFRYYRNHAFSAADAAANFTALSSSSTATANLNGTVSDPDNDPLTTLWSAVSGPGSVTFTDALAVDTTATFTAAGTYVLRLSADDGALQASDNVVVTVSEPAPNNAPGANDASITTDEDTPVAVTLTGSDPDGDALTYSMVSGPANGSLGGTAPNLTYTPAANFYGTDVFTFKVNDGSVDSSVATITVTVATVNDAPTVNAGIDQTVFLEGAAWTPAEIGSTAWYDAHDASTITANAGAVSQWRDKSGNGYHLNQPEVANQPITGSTTFNGLNLIDFAAPSDTLFTSAVNLGSGSPAMQAIHVLVPLDANANGEYFSYSTAVAGGQVFAASLSSNGGAGDYTGRFWNGFAESEVNQVLGAGFIGSMSKPLNGQHGDLAIHVDGTSTTPTLNNPTNGWNFGTTGSEFCLGAVRSDAGANGRFRAAEVLLFDRVLTDVERQMVEGYLAHKWGVADRLPAGHPYKVSAPGAISVDATLAATTADVDGDALTTLWTAVSGPSAPDFSDPTAVGTTVTFSETGTYVLRLTANDGNLQGYDEVTVTVNVASTENTAPVFVQNPIPAGAGEQGVAYSGSLAGSALDADGDTLTYSKFTGPAWLNVSAAGTLSGTPSAGDVGANSFSVGVDDGNGGSDVATLQIAVAAGDLVAPVLSVPADVVITQADSQSPTATGQATATDNVDPNPSVSYSDAQNGTSPDPYVITRTWTATDAKGNSASAEQSITIIQVAEVGADGQTTTLGTTAGNLANSSVSDNNYQTLTEVVSGNTSALDHAWTFILDAADFHVFYLEAHHGANNEGDDFVFLYSTDGISFHELLVVTKTADNNSLQTFELPAGISGSVTVTVTDLDRTGGHTSLDALHVDAIGFSSESWPAGTAPPGIASAPTPANNVGNVALDAQLQWTIGSSVNSSAVYFGTSNPPTSGDFLGTTAGGTINPGPLAQATTYFWRVDGINANGESVGHVWSFTTEEEPIVNPADMHVDSITCDTISAGKGFKHGNGYVTIRDNSGQPVAGATVTAVFSGSYNETRSALTDANGIAQLTTTATQKGGVSFTLSITNVTHSSLPYDPNDNVVTSGTL